MVPNPECAQSKTLKWYKHIETLKLIITALIVRYQCDKRILLFSLMEACCIISRMVRERMLFVFDVPSMLFVLHVVMA